MGFLKFAWDANPKETKPCDVVLKSPYDEIREINEAITKGLEKHDAFDIEMRRIRVKDIKNLIEHRNLVWFDPDLEHEGKVTLVVGRKGLDFKAYEAGR